MGWSALKDRFKVLCDELFGIDRSVSSQLQSHQTIEQQLAQLPVLRRSLKWTPEGLPCVTEIRHDPESGLFLKTTRIIKDE